MILNAIKGYNHFPDYSQVSATLKKAFNIKQLTIVAVTSHYSWVNTYKNTVIPECFYRESTLSIDSCQQRAEVTN